MLSKIWKQVLIIIVLIACLFNLVAKLATKVSFDDEMKAVTEYVKETEKEENTSSNVVTNNEANNTTNTTNTANTNKNT